MPALAAIPTPLAANPTPAAGAARIDAAIGAPYRIAFAVDVALPSFDP